MQVRCIKPFGGAEVGDVAEVPDGSQVDPAHWEPVKPLSLPPGAAEAAKELLDGLAARVTAPREEGM